MSRDIKFRAWDKVNKGFINGFNMIGYSTGQGAPSKQLQRFNSYWNDEDIVLMQCTGLRDKNGKKIYEGDILAFYQEPFGIRKEVVEFRDFCFSVGLSYNFIFNKFVIQFEDTGFEVIGNIYEHPHLIEEAQP